MIRIRIIDRYIFQELIPPFFLSMSVLTLVMFIQKMFRIAQVVISKGGSLAATIKLFILVLPNFLIISIPMSALVASLAAFTRLSSDSEVTAMKASSVSLYTMIRPVALFTGLAFFTAAFVSIIVLPASNHALRAQIFNMIKSKTMVGFEPGVFTSTFDGIIVYVNKINSLDNMEGIFIADERLTRDPYVITAKRGNMMAESNSFNVILSMQDGSIHTVPKDEQTYSLSNFVAGKFYLDFTRALLPVTPKGRDFDEMRTRELVKQLRAYRAENKPAFEIEKELHTRLSVPFACLIFGLIGAPLGIRRSRSGKSGSVAIALLVFLIYFVILGIGKNLAQAGTVPAALAYWTPNVLMTAAVVILIYVRGHEVSPVFIERLGEWMRAGRSRISNG